MDFKKLIPDFGAIGRTEWGKPYVDTKNNAWLIMTCAAALMVVFVFIPWFSATQSGWGMTVTATRFGITTWYGILGLIFTLVALYGILYKQMQFVFWGAVLAVVMGLIGWLSMADVNTTVLGVKRELTVAEIKQDLQWDPNAYTFGHIGAILFFFTSAALAVFSFLQINKEK